jgi:uroporphyrinogen-III synthase
MRLLLTRPAEDAEALRSLLVTRGYEVFVDPVLTIEALAVTLPAGPVMSVLATSANAFRCLPEDASAPLRSLPCFVVGEATLAAARAAGFTCVEAAAGDAASLLALVLERQTAADRLIYLAGRERRPELEAGLNINARPYLTVEVYGTVPATALSAEVRQALAEGSIDAVVHYSRRSAEVFVRLVQDADVTSGARAARHICLSAAVAEGLTALDGACLRVAHRPDTPSVLAALHR